MNNYFDSFNKKWQKNATGEENENTNSFDRVEISVNQSINTIYRMWEDVGWEKKLSDVKLNFSIINTDKMRKKSAASWNDE